MLQYQYLHDCWILKFRLRICQQSWFSHSFSFHESVWTMLVRRKNRVISNRTRVETNRSNMETHVSLMPKFPASAECIPTIAGYICLTWVLSCFIHWYKTCKCLDGFHLMPELENIYLLRCIPFKLLVCFLFFFCFFFFPFFFFCFHV